MIVDDVEDDGTITVREVGTGTIHDQSYTRLRGVIVNDNDYVLVGEIAGRGKSNKTRTRIVLGRIEDLAASFATINWLPFLMNETSSIELTYDYATNEFSANVKDEYVEAEVASLLFGDDGILVVWNDGADTITFSPDYGVGANTVAEGNHTHSGGSASIIIEEGLIEVIDDASAINFDDTDFNVTNPDPGRVSVSLSYGTGANQPAEGNHGHASVKTGITANFHGGGSVIATGAVAYWKVPFACTVTGWEIVADVSGSIVVTVSRAATATPTSFSEISGSSDPTLSSQQTNKDTSISGDWSDVTLDEADWLKFLVTGTPATVTVVAVALDITRTV